MRYAKIIFPILLFLPLIALGASENVPVEEFPDLLPFVVLLLFCGVCLAVICVGILLTTVALAFFALLVALGIVSTSALVGLVRRRASSGLRAFHYQLFALASAPCGVIVLGLALSLFDCQLRYRYILLLGLLAGVGAGLVMAFLFDRIARRVYSRSASKG